MPRTIPLASGLPNFDVQVRLDGQDYTLALRWNTRALAWFATLMDAQAQTTFAAGARLVHGFPLFAHLSRHQLSPPLPPGALVAFDTTGAGADPDFASLGTTTLLLYYTAAELGITARLAGA